MHIFTQKLEKFEMNVINYWIFLSICGVLLIIIPLFLLAWNVPLIQPRFPSDSPFKDALQNSNALYVLHLSIVLSILPSAVEVVMDIVEQKAAYLTSIHTNERFIFCVIMMIIGVVYLVLRSSDFIPLVYIAEYYCRNIVYICLSSIIAYSELVKDSVLLFGSIFLCTGVTVSTVISANATFYNHFFKDESVEVIIIQMVTRILNILCFGVYLYTNLLRWPRLVAIRQNSWIMRFGQLTLSEKRFLLTAIPFVFFTTLRVIWFAMYTATSKNINFWQSQTEFSLIVDLSAQYITLVFVSILTGRVIRELILTNMNTLRLKQIFVRHVSHEIRSPLNVVHAGLDLLMAEIKDADPEAATVPISRSTVELIHWIFSSSESAIEILNDLLQYEQMDAGIFNLELSWRDLNGSLHNKLNWVQIMADRGNITLSIADSTLATRVHNPTTDEADLEQGGGIEPSLLMQRDAYFHMDVFRMDQVIRNILTNAMKFTPEGGQVKVNILCEMQNQENRNKIISKFGVDAVGLFRMEVVDTGVGLSAEDQKRIFGEFTQFNKGELHGGGGSGLGLWISKRIVQMHKGSMGATSAGLGCGTTVFFELPLFSAAMAGKQPLAPLMTDYPPQPQVAMNNTPMRSNDQGRKDLPTEIMSTPDRRKPRPSSPPLTGSAIFVVDTGSDEGDASPSRQLRHKPQRGDAWASDPEVDNRLLVAESPERREVFDEAALHSQVSRVLEFGDGKDEDDDETMLPAPSDPPRQMSILIVDDSALNRKVIVKIIESEKAGRLKDARLLEADDGTTAVEMLRRELSEGRKVDFVLMDYVMIRMHGPEAATIMRQDIQYAGIIIAVTGNALPDDMARFIASGANEVLTKPLTKVKLMNALDRFMPT